MEVDSEPNAVVKDEVPGPVSRPGKDPVDPSCGENREHPFEMSGRCPHIEIGVLSRLLHQQGVNTPTPAHAYVHAVLSESAQQAGGILGRHDVPLHRYPSPDDTRPQGT